MSVIISNKCIKQKEFKKLIYCKQSAWYILSAPLSRSIFRSKNGNAERRKISRAYPIAGGLRANSKRV
ncbi:MAG: hypothetical protein K9H64_09910, partial [Bacteroidales bacterium]|nr:hypothetical protein [Bacteroidales bacterium]MCF8456182.1 hypothetical protein [Bacteroidales bacterium]